MDTVSGVDETLHYRALHIGAIVALLIGILSAIFMTAAAANSIQAAILTAFLPVAGIVLSLFTLAEIRRKADIYTGYSIAMIGLVLSLVFLVSGVGYSGYVYLTEVPEGYARTSFAAMRPDEMQERSGVGIPPEVAALNGKKVFIKGYIRPDSVTVTRGIKRFLLVRDNNQCCFGDISTIKYYDQVDVEMVGSRRVNYDQGVFRIGGILQIEPQNLSRMPMKPVFSLKADYAG
jgi:hypothetical protein